MNQHDIAALLREDESSTLDFKRDQYPFESATDAKKAELLKDILSFANAWRRSAAYILIGVDESAPGERTVIGVDHHLDDAKLQQFVNSKTNRPVHFSYRCVPFDSFELGVITIQLQDRPVYLTKPYGKLAPCTVYLRRGSSTDVAKPDEIASMGSVKAASEMLPSPSLELHLADPFGQTDFGTSISLEVCIAKPPDDGEIPNASSGMLDIGVNRDFYRQVARFLVKRDLLRPVGFVARNTGSSLISSARIDMRLPTSESLIVRDQGPTTPDYNTMFSHIRVPELGPQVTVNKTLDQWTVEIPLGDIQPKAVVWVEGPYIGSIVTRVINPEIKVFADNLPDPITVPLEIRVSVSSRTIDLDEVMKAGREIAEAR